MQAELLKNQTDLTGVLYWNKGCEFQIVSMITDPFERSQRGDWCVGQHGTRLSRGSEPVRFNRAGMCGEIVVSMRPASCIGTQASLRVLNSHHDYQLHVLARFRRRERFSR